MSSVEEDQAFPLKAGHSCSCNVLDGSGATLRTGVFGPEIVGDAVVYFLRYLLFRTDTFPEPSILTKYWSLPFDSITMLESIPLAGVISNLVLNKYSLSWL